MQKVKLHNLPSQLSLLLLALLLTFSTNFYAQDESAASAEVAPNEVIPADGVGDVAAGEALFKANCAACHKLDKKATGPLLRGVASKYETDWLYRWIKNSQDLVKAGDPIAVKIFAENNNSVMTAFPALSNTDIDNILAYTSQPKPEPTVAVVPTGTGGESSGASNDIILGVLILVFLMLVIMLFLVTKTLKKIATANGVAYPEKEVRTPIWRTFIENQFLVLVASIFLLLSAGYFMYGYFMQVGIDQGYAPVQPIHYSHRIHAGDNQIDCKYCHSSARTSKTSGIPSLNVCMNCHKNISEVAEATQAEGAEYGVDYNKEIKKLYDAVGWNEATQSYTGIEKPVKWLRIHNLPDFAYFNHSQHVTVAGIECQKCHGPVEEMEVLEQFAPLTMGWCINCHRETNVNLAGNEYYEKIHEELSKKYGVDKLTIAQMGGLECGKCHY
ncbi:quinol:cytochrome c oxidoreductase pentaheme cytochrome subunit [Ulvibacter sp. MAR_2010_11]|uniref:c-type cytochrome n=1 Tax=Ulvibacter sp. MAR_2010_11 TaxID=1250229 RepID=UPI000C2BF2B0|nr:c-type cytochrome [Ulvibacter sp. MAR_2010_11]PKA83243.1 quinol:cytochrome c oxidoreductase pentaheme cytochrome subunit [Ulvibacter sp. MAR_2010_11]